jgi:hypothetical protein
MKLTTLLSSARLREPGVLPPLPIHLHDTKFNQATGAILTFKASEMKFTMVSTGRHGPPINLSFYALCTSNAQL